MPIKDQDRKPQPRSREARLAEQLRVNLQRRKAQLRSRRQGEPDRREDGLDVAETPGDGSV